MRPQPGKQKLFVAAMKLFEQQGYFATTVEQITKEAGVSKGLVYNYFKSKEELLVALLDEYTIKMESIASNLQPSSDSTTQVMLQQFIDTLFTFMQQEKNFLRLQLNLMLMPELKDVVQKPQIKRAESLLAMVTDWFEQLSVVNAENQARIFVALLDGIALHYLVIYPNYPLQQMKAQLLKSTMDLCCKQEAI